MDVKTVKSDTVEKSALLDPTMDWRSGKDRRRSDAKFPLIDSHGNVVMADRRMAPDRRLDSVKVEEISVDKVDFDSLFNVDLENRRLHRHRSY